MLIPEAGVHQTSERYFFTPSSLARELFYYLTRCGHYFCDHNYAFSDQSEIARQGDHNRNLMLFAVQGGSLTLQLRGETMLAAAGQVVFFDCREPYRYAACGPTEFYWLLLNGSNARDFYRRILQARGGKHVFSPAGSTALIQLLSSLLAACAEGEPPSEAACSQLLHQALCLLLLDETGPGQRDDDRISQAIRFMRQNLQRPLSVQDVAQAVHLSPSHFSRQFKAQTGYSPYEYIVLRRIDAAKHLLTSTRLTVGEIAYQTGYNSEENFIHSFQKHVGISPGLFRQYPI